MAKAIGTLGTIPTLTVGGQLFTDLTTLITLTAFTKTGGVNAGFRLPGATSARQVTTGKTFTVNAMKSVSAGNTSYGSALLYADNDVGMATATAFTNPIYYANDAAYSVTTMSGNPSGMVRDEIGSLNFPVPALKYVSVLGTTGVQTSNVIYGYEV